MIRSDILSNLQRSLCESEQTYKNFEERLQQGAFTRDENPTSHLCLFFLPYNRKTGEVFLVHHKKAQSWIAPGGHVDEGESAIETLNREILEELGVKNAYKESPRPFLFTIFKIDNEFQTCKTHYDPWYLYETDGSNFKVDPTEFLDTKWMSIDDALEIADISENITALKRLRELQKSQ